MLALGSTWEQGRKEAELIQTAASKTREKCNSGGLQGSKKEDSVMQLGPLLALGSTWQHGQQPRSWNQKTAERTGSNEGYKLIDNTKQGLPCSRNQGCSASDCCSLHSKCRAHAAHACPETRKTLSQSFLCKDMEGVAICYSLRQKQEQEQKTHQHVALDLWAAGQHAVVVNAQAV